MNLIAFEGVVDAGQIKLPPNVQLPDKAKVFVVVPDASPPTPARIFSPRLANPAQAKDFVLEVVEVSE
jgi:hypothetical protein